MAKDGREGGGDGEEERFNDDPENETGLFSSLPYDAEDEEADRIYAEVDDKMDERRRVRREAREREERLKAAKERPKLQMQFSDAKREMSKMTKADWDAIPDAGNLSRRKYKKDTGRERFVPVPDSILAQARDQNELAVSLDSRQQILGGLETPAPSTADGIMTDFVAIGAARDRVLGVKLDQVSDSISGQTTIDPKGYLTDLNSIVIKSEAEIGDIKKARLLLKSVITTNPKHAPGWIAAARLEEIAGRLVQARSMIAKGCEECPKSEDVWIEAARLNINENAKVILAEAVRQLPRSVKIWLQAARLESEVLAQKRVLRRALEFVPTSVKIWKAAISLEENANDARILLSRAVECAPTSVELWLALTKLETYEKAKVVLNAARKAVPTSHEIWIAAARLREVHETEDLVDKVIRTACGALIQSGTVLTREEWLKEAQECEKVGSVMTCRAIVRNTIALGLERQDYKPTWTSDAESCTAKGAIQTARAIYTHALKVFPTKKSIWRRAAFLEKQYGTRETLEQVLSDAVKHCEHAEMLWLMYAKEKWLAGSVIDARKILAEAFRANPKSSQIWLAAVKLEQESGEYLQARKFLQKAREQAGDEPRVWMKSAVLERLMGNLEECLTILEEALTRFPSFAKFWVIWSQVEEQRGDLVKAREVLSKGRQKCQNFIPLWKMSAQLEEKSGMLIRARAVLERSRLLNPKNGDLWCESIRVENRAGNTTVAKALMAKALQECPTSGLLWAESIFMEPRPQRKGKSVDALKKCGDSDLHVVLAIARLFWIENKLDKARSWFARASKIDSDWGDVWAYNLKFEYQHGTKEQQQDVISRCVAAEPHHGEHWAQISKSLQNIGKSTEEILEQVVMEAVVYT